MTMFKLLAAAAAVAGVAAPVAAQAPYGYPQQTYPNQYGNPNQYGYGNQGNNVIGQVIDQLLGNRYNVTDRRAVSQCANAAMIQAQAQYRGGYSGYGQQGYGQQGYGHQQGIAAPALRVTAITDVQRRNSGLRVKGLMSSGYAGQYNQHGNQYGYNQNRNYAAGDLSFRCNVDYRGAVTNVRISRNDNNGYRRY